MNSSFPPYSQYYIYMKSFVFQKYAKFHDIQGMIVFENIKIPDNKKKKEIKNNAL